MVRNADLNDLEAIVNLWQQMSTLHESYDTSYSLKEDACDKFKLFAETVIMDNEKLSIVFDDGNVDGYLFAEIINQPPVYFDKRIGMITEISITKVKRRSGIGNILVQYAENWFINRGITIIDCHVASKNPISTSFWTKNKYMEYSKICRKNL